MSSAEQTFEQLCHHMRDTALYSSVEALLNFDERTGMPPEAGPYRAEQITLLAGLTHERRTAPQVGQWLDELIDSHLAQDPASDSGATIRWLKRQYEKKVKLPKSLVEEIAGTTVRAQQCWGEARPRNDFASLRPWWEKILELKRQEADAVGYAECRYDALLDDYEPGALTSDVNRVLGALRDDLVPLVAAVGESKARADVGIVKRTYPIAAQKSFARRAAQAIGFDFARGRLDETTHPFCSTLGPNDIGITTRYDEQFFSSAFFGVLHEAGHGIYEQGLRTDQFGLPLGEYASLGIHESQSRMWENLVGRSHAFWEHFFADAQEAFPQALGDTPLEDFYFAINDVRPSLIRVEADEATYNLHILIRFELEQALLHDELSVADLPAAWNDKYHQFLDIDPPDDTDGVMQDIHWSAGLFGYFATYSLGNLYAAQFFDQAEQEVGPLNEQFAAGDFQPLRDWLRTKIHHQGRRFSAAELAEKVTGKPLSHAAMIAQLKKKLSPLYGI